MRGEKARKPLEEEKRRLESEATVLRAELQRISKLRVQGYKTGSRSDRSTVGLKWVNKLGEVAHWFSQDPAACLKDRSSRTVLRTYEHPYRYWYPLLSKGSRHKVLKLHLGKRPDASEENVRKLLDLDQFENVEKRQIERQQLSFWDDLRKQLLELKLPPGLENRFSDLLTGYLLVLELQTEQRGKLWRAFKRSRRFQKMGITQVMTITAVPPHREHLQTRILALMAEDLTKHGWSKKREIYSRFIIPVWGLIEIKIRDDESLLRQVRRARQKTKIP